MLIKVWLFAATLLSLGCSRYPVSGNIDMTNSDKRPIIYMVEPSSFASLASSFEGKVIDSTKIDSKGNFKFEKMPAASDQKMYLLTIQKQGEKYANKLEIEQPELSNYIPFIYQSSDNIIIHSSADHLLKDAQFKGSENGNEIIKLFANKIKLSSELLANSGETDESNLLQHEKDLFEFQKSMMATIQDNNNVAINALALRWISPNGDYERIPELVKQTCQKLNTSSPNHPWTIQICQKSASLPLVAGDQFPDFPLPMSNGDTIKLYHLFAKKLTLIDLWASWCAPCRNENRNMLVPLWDQFHDQGFQIVGYALDSSDKGWKSAIEKDGANRWLHSSHLKGDESPFFEILKISTIPANYLVNEKGMIVAKNLHGEEMQKWVSEYMKQ